MAVFRIVANIATTEPSVLAEFYHRLFGLDPVMDHGWITTVADQGMMRTQVSFASEGGSGTPVPALSIEVDDVDELHRRASELGVPIPYPLTNEDWGVRRFFLRDPAGTLVNVVQHRHDA